ncbi:unnamed protein product, partial [Meganyctiphanes norvegica]
RRLKEQLLSGLVVLLTLACAGLVAFIIADKVTSPIPVVEPPVCTSPACLRAASHLLDKMDRTTAPCENFYQFACGNYLHENVVPDDSLYRSAMQEMHEEVLVIIKKMLDQPQEVNETEAIGKAKRLYHSCMNTSFTVHEKDMADSPIFNLLSSEHLGAWPLLDPDNWSDDQYDLEGLLANLTLYQVHTFLESYITPDEKNSSIYTLHFYKGSPALARNYYLNQSNEEYTRYMMAYRVLLKEAVSALAGQGGVVNETHIDEVIEFETLFANISDSQACGTEPSGGNLTAAGNMTDSLGLDEEETSGRMKVTQLEELIPEIKWGDMLRATLDQFDLDLDVDSLIVTLHCNKYVPELVELLQDTPKRVIVNYMLWRFVLRYMPYISNYFEQLWQQFRSE